MWRKSALALRTMTTLAKLTPSKHPLIVIVGATGTGKSKLAVSLATRFNGEIINADAVQMYKGLPILTNKIPEVEQNGIKHHLIDHIGLEDEPWTVHQFVDQGSNIIAAIRARGKLPIVVGGTGYYVYGLLLRDSLLPKDEEPAHNKMNGDIGHVNGNANGDGNDDGDDRNPAHFPILNASSEEMYAKLNEVDPEMARQWHPRDRRKIQRSLEIWLRTGRKASDIYAEQKRTELDGSVAVEDDPLIFWMEAEDKPLKQRLNERVDTMVENGLLDEVTAMRQFELDSRQKGVKVDQDRGIWIAIGYKEFNSWLDMHQRGEVNPEILNQLRREGTEAVQAGTRRYAKSQNRWIRIKLAKALEERNLLDKLFLLDCTHLDKWDTEIAKPSELIIQAFIDGRPLPVNTSLSHLASQMFDRVQMYEVEGRQTHFCETCQKTLMTEAEWKKHLGSNSHKKVLDGIRKRAARQQHLQQLSSSPG